MQELQLYHSFSKEVTLSQVRNYEYKPYNFLPCLSLLTVSIDASSATLQQTENNPSLALNDSRYTTTENAVSVINRNSSINDPIDTKYKTAVDRLQQQAASIKEYAKANHFNPDYCFL